MADADERRTVGRWVLLAYRLPREPSTPRITVWRKLERLGVARLGDGLVALPADARTREQMDWLAERSSRRAGSRPCGWPRRAAPRRSARSLPRCVPPAPPNTRR